MAAPTPDVLTIARLLRRERFYRDTAQWAPCRSAFHPDDRATYINVAWYEGSVDDFLRRSAALHASGVNVIHSGFDPVDVRVRGRRATSEAFCTATSGVGVDGVDYELASHMRLFSRLERLGVGWRIVSLESSYVRDRLVPAFPGSQSSVVVSDRVAASPKAYRALAFVMSRRGLEPRPSLPHEGDPGSIRAIQERNRAFLEEVDLECSESDGVDAVALE